jgi:predicted nucleic acid-binding protein
LVGVRNPNERTALRAYEQVLPDLPITPEVWKGACALAERSRRTDKTVPAMDALIAACAVQHGVELMYADAHFEQLLAT